jgi:hypothetical protein
MEQRREKSKKWREFRLDHSPQVWHTSKNSQLCPWIIFIAFGRKSSLGFLGVLSSNTTSACHFEPKAVYCNKIGRISLPFSVKAHLTTTIGGFSFSMHFMNPSFSSSFKRIDKTLGVKPGVESRIRLNLSTPRIPMSLSTSSVHFFPNTPKLALIGH